VVGGAGLAILFNQSKMLEMSFYPYAVILQVTPIVSIAPLIFIYVDSKIAGMLLCAWLVAFFPVLSSTTLGLNSVDHNLRDLFRSTAPRAGSGCASCNCPRPCPISSAG
jgi:NitT/TauT family transport system permease protein